MNLFSITADVVGWCGRIGVVFFRLRPMTTGVVIAASALSMVMAILAFVLPLKVILLVASDGVSRWFQPFVGPEGKDTLVLVLSVAAVGSFFGAIVLDALTTRLAASTSNTVLRGSNELAVIGNQTDTAQNVYAQFAETVAGGLFVLAGFGLIGAVNPLLMAVLVGLVCAEFALTAIILARGDQINPGAIAGFVTGSLGGYLNILSSVNFLVAFLVLLYPFVWGSGGDVLVALVSIIVLRRILGVMTQTVQGLVKMVKRRPVINALVFREKQYHRHERYETRTLRDVFHKEARQRRAGELLEGIGIKATELDVRWEDARLPGMSSLLVGFRDDTDRDRWCQQQIYLSKQAHRLENEGVLFSYIDRTRMLAPRVLARFDEGPFECQVCEAGAGVSFSSKEWNDTEVSIFARIMSVQPPPELRRAYTTSRPLLGDRLSDEFIGRLSVAVDTPEEAETLAKFRQVLPAVREQVHALPLYVHNPEIRQSNVLQDEDGSPVVMTWGRWSLEPVGAGWPRSAGGDRTSAVAAQIQRERTDVPEGFCHEHLEFGQLVSALEFHIEKNLLKTALQRIEVLLESSVIADWVDQDCIGQMSEAI